MLVDGALTGRHRHSDRGQAGGPEGSALGRHDRGTGQGGESADQGQDEQDTVTHDGGTTEHGWFSSQRPAQQRCARGDFAVEQTDPAARPGHLSHN